jgi:hypothetical protein
MRDLVDDGEAFLKDCILGHFLSRERRCRAGSISSAVIKTCLSGFNR